MTQVISEPTAQTVRAGVNERQFFANMKNMFASSYSFLGELLQNARRAGATRVDVTFGQALATVQVRDDGTGVEDFQALITLAQSGWNEQTIQAERPFGMGLFSALFAAKEVVIRSRGKRLRVTIEDVIAKNDLTVQNDEFTSPGTLIELRDLPPTMRTHDWRQNGDELIPSGCPEGKQFVLITKCRNLAEGFAIPVLVNGQELPRPQAQGSLAGVQTEIGFIHLPGLHSAYGAGDYADIAATGGFYGHPHLFLQGLPIQHDRLHAHSLRPVIHLDTAQFSPKLPDRAYLVDYEQAHKRIEAVIQKVIRGWTEAAKAQLSPRDFVQKFWCVCRNHGWGDLLNDVPLFPAAALEGNFPMRVDYQDMEADTHPGVTRDGMQGPDPLISREDVESGRVLVWKNVPTNIDDSSAVTALDVAVANALGVYTPKARSFPDDHWLLDAVPYITDMRYTVEPVNAGASAAYTGSFDHDSVTMTLVDGVKITVQDSSKPGQHKEVLIEDAWLLAPSSFAYTADGDMEASGDAVVYLPKVNKLYDHPVDALCSYMDDEHYDDDWRTRSQSLWDGIESTLRGAKMSEIVRTALLDGVQHRPLEAHMGQMVLVSGARWGNKPDSETAERYREWVARDLDSGLIAELAEAFEATDSTLATAERLTHALNAIVRPGEERT